MIFVANLARDWAIRLMNEVECPRSSDLGYLDFADPESFTALEVSAMSASFTGTIQDESMTPPQTDPPFELPRYTHIPGVTPHPIGDPEGHSFGMIHPACPPPDWASLPQCELFQRGCQLFNAGYYWEAHEAWEGVWIAAGRTGLVADFVKGLIKLAAAGVKLREGSLVGAQRHLARSKELLLLTRSRLSGQTLVDDDPSSATEGAEPLAAPSGFNVELPLALVERLQSQLPEVPPPNAGQAVPLLGRI